MDWLRRWLCRVIGHKWEWTKVGDYHAVERCKRCNLIASFKESV